MTFHDSDSTLGAWCSIGDPNNALSLLSAAPDWLVLDAQHGSFDQSSLRTTLNATTRAHRDIPVWVRVSGDDAAEIGSMLDMGAAGVIVPMIEAAPQAQAVTRSCLYPPEGGRSFGPASLLAGDPVTAMAEANAQVSCSLMIETATALENVEEIAATEGAESLFVGPFDLAASLGASVDALLDDESQGSAVTRIVDAAHSAGLRARVFAGDMERAALLRARGFDDIAALTDFGLLQAGARAAAAKWRSDLSSV